MASMMRGNDAVSRRGTAHVCERPWTKGRVTYAAPLNGLHLRLSLGLEGRRPSQHKLNRLKITPALA